MTIPMVIALDVGGTSIKGAVLDADLWPAAELREPTGREDGPEVVVARVLDALESLRRMAGSRAVAAGLVVPGIVDTPSGTAVWSENIGWRDIPLRALAEERLAMPVAFGHDVRAGGLAELRVGAARDAHNAVFLPIGTGIAAAMVVDGRVLDAGGYAGEVGHVDVGQGEPCACGGWGCLEAISSAAEIGRRYATVVSGGRHGDGAGRHSHGTGRRRCRLGGLGGSTGRFGARAGRPCVAAGTGGRGDRGRVGVRIRSRFWALGPPRRDAGLPAAPAAGRFPAGRPGRLPRRRPARARPGGALIVTVTPNPALDLTYTVDGFAAGHVHRVRSVEQHPGPPHLRGCAGPSPSTSWRSDNAAGHDHRDQRRRALARAGAWARST